MDYDPREITKQQMEVCKRGVPGWFFPSLMQKYGNIKQHDNFRTLPEVLFCFAVGFHSQYLLGSTGLQGLVTSDFLKFQTTVADIFRGKVFDFLFIFVALPGRFLCSF